MGHFCIRTWGKATGFLVQSAHLKRAGMAVGAELEGSLRADGYFLVLGMVGTVFSGSRSCWLSIGLF